MTRTDINAKRHKGYLTLVPLSVYSSLLLDFKLIDVKMLTIPYSEGVVLQPIAEYDDPFASLQCKVNQKMPMPEEVIVDLGMLYAMFLGKAHE